MKQEYTLYIHWENSSVVRLQLRSWHKSSKYITWIKTGTGSNPIIKWYCQCKVGIRVVACCAHVVSVLFYLRYRHHSQTQTKVASLEYVDIIEDTATGWSSDDSAGGQ